MFRRITTFRRKERDEGRQFRVSRAPSDSRSPGTSPPPSPGATAGEDDARLSSVPSSLSDGQLPSLAVLSGKPSETESGMLGLNVVYTPDYGHKADIVFIHGLGGTSRWTWSKNKDPDLFWPLTFLALEPDLCLARILTFGYNATLRKAGTARLSVLDFAKDLLFNLKYAKNQRKDELNMGSVPLIFVAHSMGGLIIKEAYIQGQHDPTYEAIVRSITAITFLATPHRGTQLAQTLNKILQSSMITNSKQYVADLATNSLTLQKLNEQFRHIAPKLDIVSFYETQPTSIGIKNHRVMVLEKDSSVLGYPGEMSKALDADHHGVCKYDSPDDPNYITVRNVLKTIMAKIVATRRRSQLYVHERKQSSDLKAMLSIDRLPDIDYIFFQDQRSQGTNEWIMEEEAFRNWLCIKDPTSQILWLHGGPATGKSVMSSFLVNHLVMEGRQVQYFFIRFGDQKKQSLNFLLRSIAFQVARSVPQFAHLLTELGDGAVDLETADARTVWERVFRSLLFTVQSEVPLFWIIDGLDEADDPQAVVRVMSDLSSTCLPIRVLFVSRTTTSIRNSMDKASKSTLVNELGIEGHTEDLRSFVTHELNVSGSETYRKSVENRLIDGARNNFLWVRLAVNRINSCHRQADVELALQELPSGMEALYDRMGVSVASISSDRDKSLAVAILKTVVCALRGLKLDEMAEALPDDTSEVLDLQKSILDLCGGFITVDSGGNVAMVHHTAREYLLANGDAGHSFGVQRAEAHTQLFQSCMRCIVSKDLRGKVSRGQSPAFLDYAVDQWAAHMSLTSQNCEQTRDSVRKFLAEPCVLTWIHIAALKGQLRLLVQAARSLSKMSSRLTKEVSLRPIDGQEIIYKELLDCWAVDLIKVVGKFGLILRRHPEAIYRLIPPFCPRSSAIYQQFGKTEARLLQVSGLSTETWDDAFARMEFGSYMSSMAVAASSVAFLASAGKVLLYDSESFEQMPGSPIQHGERVYRMELDDSATLLATYGYRNVKVWELPSGDCKWAIPNLNSKPRPLAMRFLNHNKSLLIGTDDRRVRAIDLTQATPVWSLIAELEEPELEGHIFNAANLMAFNREGSLTAVAYRGHPLSAWETDGPTHIAHCWRMRDEVARGEVIEAIWCPHSPEVVGLYLEGVVFKWSPYDGEIAEMSTGANKLAMSKRGNLFATGDVHGRVKIYTVAGFGLLYQLASQDTVLGVAFSPDARRLYDLRGYYGNTWEPTALMRFAEQSRSEYDSQSETESIAKNSSTFDHTTLRVDHITAIAASPLGHLYCYGSDKGTVSLYSLQEGKLSDVHNSKASFSIESMTWSDDGQLIAFSDSSKKVFIAYISLAADKSSPASPEISDIAFKGIARGPILQLMFAPDSRRLLVHSSSVIHIVSLDSSTILHKVELVEDELKCLAHPHNPLKLLGIGARAIFSFDWETSEVRTYGYDLPSVSSDEAAPTKIESALISKDKKHILVQSCGLGGSQHKKLFFSVKTTFLATTPIGNTGSSFKKPELEPISTSTLPDSISAHINKLLSFLSGGRVIFLSRDYAVCSWQFTNQHKSSSSSLSGSRSINSSTGSKAFKELFYLPGDWASREASTLSFVWRKENIFVCPKNGEIGLVKSSNLA